MEETEQKLLIEDDADATMITPRFDEGETITAQPVVPLADVSPDATNYAALKHGARRPWPLALVLISALVGSALGGAGFYFYQQRQETPDESASETPPRVSVPDETASPSTAPAQVERPAPAADIAGDNNPRAENSRDEKDARKNRDDAAPRKVVETDEQAGATKHGKKGERDAGDVAAQLPQRPRRVETAPPSDAEQTARRIGTIIYPENRKARQTRARREPDQHIVDRVRGIFEGQPPQ